MAIKVTIAMIGRGGSEILVDENGSERVRAALGSSPEAMTLAELDPQGASFAGRYDHLILDLRVAEIPPADEVERWARSMLPKHGIRVLSSTSHDFDSPVPGFAYTLLLVLSASHMAVHTAPEHHWIQVAFSLCDGRDRRSALEQEAVDFFRPERIEVSSLSTGANWT